MSGINVLLVESIIVVQLSHKDWIHLDSYMFLLDKPTFSRLGW